jgi:hypothetical protein
VHENIGRRLAALQATANRDAADAKSKAADARWRSEMPSVDRNLYLLLGPVVDTSRCVGVEATVKRECAREWDEAAGGSDSSSR